MQISIKGYITSKESELFYDCADRFAYNKEQHKFAISDGVSKAFFPKIWADILVSNWVKNQWDSDEQFIESCQTEWLKQVTEIVEKPDVKWFTKNAFNRKEAGLATFVGLHFFEDKKEWRWKANALGDSFLFFVPNDFKDFETEVIRLSSKEEPIKFDNFPDYLSSIGDNHKGKKNTKEELLSEGTFYLMTDALAEWFITEKENAIGKIDVWQNQKDFERFVNEERLNNKLGNDDSAILIIEIRKDNKDKLSFVAENVSNIDELIKEQKAAQISEVEIEIEKPDDEKTKIEPESPKEKKGFFDNLFSRENTKTKIDTDPTESSEKENSEITEEKKVNNEDTKNEITTNESQKTEENLPKKTTQNITDKF